VLLHPFQVLFLSLRTFFPLQFGDAFLPAVAGGPALDGPEGGRTPQTGAAGVGAEEPGELSQAAVGPELEVEIEGAFLSC